MDVNFCRLVSVVEPVVTVTKSLLAPAGTMAVRKVEPVSFLEAATPLNLTTEEELNPCPKIPICDPTLPDAAVRLMKGLWPSTRLKMIPSRSARLGSAVERAIGSEEEWR